MPKYQYKVHSKEYRNLSPVFLTVSEAILWTLCRCDVRYKPDIIRIKLV